MGKIRSDMVRGMVFDKVAHTCILKIGTRAYASVLVRLKMPISDVVWNRMKSDIESQVAEHS